MVCLLTEKPFPGHSRYKCAHINFYVRTSTSGFFILRYQDWIRRSVWIVHWHCNWTYYIVYRTKYIVLFILCWSDGFWWVYFSVYICLHQFVCYLQFCVKLITKLTIEIIKYTSISILRNLAYWSRVILVLISDATAKLFI